METDLIREFKALTDETDEGKISSFIAGAKRTVLIKTNRKTLINELEEAVLQLAVARYNKNGNEGLSSYSEGGINESYLSEDGILSGIIQYRLSPTARRIQDEKEKSEEVSS